MSFLKKYWWVVLGALVVVYYLYKQSQTNATLLQGVTAANTNVNAQAQGLQNVQGLLGISSLTS